MAFPLPALPYPPDALEASIYQRPLEIHHGKHHHAHLTNLNAALAGRLIALVTPATTIVVALQGSVPAWHTSAEA